MIELSIERDPEAYVDYKRCLSLLSAIKDEDYEYPPYLVYFHVYSEIKDDRELLSVESYFATQSLARTKLVLWSDYDIRGNELLRPYAHLIDFRVFEPLKLAKGTPLHRNRRVLSAKDTKHYMQSGLLRFLAPYVMGGVWLDMDMVLLRDLKPILDQEFAYQWGSETDFSGFGPCAAFMNIKKGSEHAAICLEELERAPIEPNSVSRDHQMLKKVYARRPFTVFPSGFFNTEWLVNKRYAPLGILMDQGWFKKNEYSGNLFLEAFAWHWHNGGGSRVSGYEEGSKFDLISKYIHKKLKERSFLGA
jgi:hypothetical protein